VAAYDAIGVVSPRSLDARAAGSGPESDGVATALRPVLPSMLAATAHTGGLTPEVGAWLHSGMAVCRAAVRPVLTWMLASHRQHKQPDA